MGEFPSRLFPTARKRKHDISKHRLKPSIIKENGVNIFRLQSLHKQTTHAEEQVCVLIRDRPQSRGREP